MLEIKYLFKEQTLFLAAFGGIPTFRHSGVSPSAEEIPPLIDILICCERLFRTSSWYFSTLFFRDSRERRENSRYMLLVSDGVLGFSSDQRHLTDWHMLRTVAMIGRLLDIQGDGWVEEIVAGYA